MPSQPRTSIYLNDEDRAAIERIRAKMIGGDRLSVSWIVRIALAQWVARLEGDK